MPHPKSPVPAELGDRFHVHAALAAGVSLRRLRNPDLEAPSVECDDVAETTTSRSTPSSTSAPAVTTPARRM